MKTEKVLEILSNYTASLEDADRIKEIVASRQRVRDLTPEFTLANLMIDLREDIAATEMKASGRRSVLSGCKRILKTAEKEFSHSSLTRAWIGQDGRQYFCSGYHAVALVTPLDVPMQDPAEASRNSGLEQQLNDVPARCIPVELPSLATVKTHLKICKAAHEYFVDNKKAKTVVWDFGPGIGLVNAQYLADILEALPGANCVSPEGSDIKPFFFRDDAGNSAILLPVRPKDCTRERTADRYTVSC